MMNEAIRNLRLAARLLAKSPGFTAVAVLSLGLGIGANSAIFSLVNGLLLKPLPHVERPAELVTLYTTHGGAPSPDGLSFLDVRDLQKATETFADVTAYTPLPLSLGDGGEPEALWGCIATGNYFPLLGVRAAVGRTLLPDDDRAPGQSPVAVISHGLWQRRFAGDPNVVGRTVHLNGHPFTVVGVAPEGFVGTEVIVAPELWVPMAMQAQVDPGNGDVLNQRDARLFRAVARLRSGVGVAAAQARTRLLGRRLEQEYPVLNRGTAFDLVPESEARIEIGIGKALAFAAAAFLVLVGLVLLIACGNVANLLLARAAARRREVSIRIAIGASRGRLIGQLLTESALLSILGGVVGLLIAFWSSRLLGHLRLPTSLPLRLDVALDGRVVLFTLIVSLLASLAFGLAPSLQTTRVALVPALKGAEAKPGKAMSLSKILVVLQVAVSLVLLVCAGLFLRSLWRAQSADLGLEPRGVLAVSLDVSLHEYSEEAGRRFYQALSERARALPGARSAALAGPVPLDYRARGLAVVPEGGQLPPGEDRADVFYSAVDADYFRTVGTPLLRGRWFDAGDVAGHLPVAVVNEELARRFWPGADPLGRRLRFVGEVNPVQVVGVVRDGKYRNLAEKPQPYLFVAFAQRYTPAATLLVRTKGDPAALLSAVRGAVRELDPSLAIADARPLDELISGRTLLPMRLAAILAGAFGALGLLLATTGLYGLMAHSVARRTREIGIRMALGARTTDVLRLVLRQGLTLTGLGLAAGFLLIFLLAGPLSGLLLGGTALDPVVFAAVAAGLTLSALAASWLPARRAARVSPLVSLKYD